MTELVTSPFDTGDGKPAELAEPAGWVTGDGKPAELAEPAGWVSTAPGPWVVLAVPPLPPCVVSADPPRSALPAQGEHVVDPGRSTVTLSVRRWGRWLRFTRPVAGRMRAERSAELAVDLAVDLAELAGGTGPGLWIGAASPTAVNGVWALQGSAEVNGVRRPLNLWLDPVDRRPDGGTRLTAAGGFDGRDVGLPAPLAARRVRIDLRLVIT